MPAFAAGATIEQRYPGWSMEDARRAAGPQISAFAGEGWTIAGEAWRSATMSAVPAGSSPAVPAVGGGFLVVTFRAERDADLPMRLSTRLVEPEGPRMLSPFAIRIVVALVVAVLLLVLFAYLVNNYGMPVATPRIGVVTS
jgi:hypothetical protein